jgi:tetratricopeptide (TPR) repeat protein/tRNA A-37 threonylcarbamoyl transferase component Bud32
MTDESELEAADASQLWLELLETTATAGSQSADAAAASARIGEPPGVETVRRCLGLLDELWPSAAGATVGDSENSVDDQTPLEDWHPGESLDFLFNLLATADERPKRFGRFIIGERLGRGGHGFVFRAHDPVLNRDVALKIPRPNSLASPQLRRRFVDEAQVLARLQHPNLVSVLEAGTVGPVCYLVTPYCRGPSLAEWIKRQEKPIAIELAATLVRDLATTVDYVHFRGILHRDIKPSNVLLELLEPASGEADCQFGFTPKLTDFGLAKLTQNSVEQTATGAILGTPAYMAPEQVVGRLADVGVATDVYALGATLYELLTGGPPFRGNSELQTLRLITDGYVVPPRRLRADIPRDLEAICLKCLELEPSRRYHSARDLADDLAALVEQRPVRARPCGPLKRALKWGRRRPLVAALAALLIVSTAMGLGAASWQWLRAESHRQTAEGNFHLAHKAVKDFHELLFQRDAYDAPEFVPLRDEVLQTALPYYDQLLAQRTTSPEIRADIADVYYQLGHVALSSNNWEKALSFYRKAAGLRRELVNEEPENWVHREFLGTICQRIGTILHFDCQSTEAIRWLENAAEIQRKIVDRHPQQMGPRIALVETFNALVRVHLACEKVTPAAELANQAIELCRTVPPHGDTRPSEVQRYLADAYVSSSRVQSASGDANGAVESCRRAIEIQRQLTAQDLEMPTAASKLATSLMLLANLYDGMGHDEQTLEQYGQAIEVLETLAERYPAVAAFQRKLAETSYALAAHHDSQGRADDALQLYHQASVLWDRLLKSHPQNLSLRYSLMRANHRIARIHILRERLEEARAAAVRGMELFHDRPPQADLALVENEYVSLDVVYQRLKGIETRVLRELVQR